MALTFENLIDHNRRVSVTLVLVMVLFLTALGGMFSLALWGGTDPALFYDNFAMGAIIGASLASIGSLVSYYAGGIIITGISNARRIEHHQDPVLFNVVEEMAIAAGVPPPKVYVIYDEAPNAFATGRDPQHALIGITTGLRKKLNRDELQAVIAHEMAHIKNYDIRLMMLIGVFAGIIVLMSDLFVRHFLDTFQIRGKRRKYRRSGGGNHNPKAFWYTLLFMALGVLLAWLAPIIAKILQLAISREREYLADSTAVQLCRNPGALASALHKIAMDTEALECANRATEHMFIINPNPKRKISNFNNDSIWSTHPPVIKRIARMNKLVRKYDMVKKKKDAKTVESASQELHP